MDINKDSSLTTNFVPGSFNPLSREVTHYIRQSFCQPACNPSQAIGIKTVALKYCRRSGGNVFLENESAVKCGPECKSIEYECGVTSGYSKCNACVENNSEVEVGSVVYLTNYHVNEKNPEFENEVSLECENKEGYGRRCNIHQCCVIHSNAKVSVVCQSSLYSEKEKKNEDITQSEEKVCLETENEGEKFSNSCELDLWLRMLSLPPRCTTLRVNLLATTLDKALLMIKSYIEEQYRDKCLPLPLVYPHHFLPDLLVVESCGVHEVKLAGKQVVVSRLCGCAVLRGAEVFAPGVMAVSSDVRTGDKVAIFADLDGRCLKGSKVYNGRKMFLGNGVALMTRRDLFVAKRSTGVAVSMKEQIFHSPSIGDCFQDLIFLQNLPSVICGHILKPEKHSVVLDMCAAPGGKTTHIASLMCNTGQVIAIDKSKNKLAHVMANSERLGLTNVKAYHFDSTKLVMNKTNNLTKSPKIDTVTEGLTKSERRDETLVPPFHHSSFKYILLDAPCSALGQRPQLHTKMSLKELQSFPAVQRRLLKNAVELLQPGGRLVYSTCTIVPEENERMVRWVLDRFRDIVLVDSGTKFGMLGLPGCGLDHDECSKVQRFGPAFFNNEAYIHDTKKFLYTSENNTYGKKDHVPSAKMCVLEHEICIHNTETPLSMCDSVVHSNATSFACVDHDTIGFFIAVFTKVSLQSLSEV